ncbi:MAG: DUF962 domain-containing protein [Xanthomonadaceae bacterium]|jgi:uncharacterized membrane protein YGL010W|nr:DUF962 domain-containing protein [Xanthomonadaceae bacterium]
MATTDPLHDAPVDTRRAVDRWLGNYSEDHRHPTNILLHHVCVPLIVWTVVAFFWVIPVPPGIGEPGLWAALAMVGALGWYLRLSRPLGLAMVAVFVVLGAITHVLYGWLGATQLLSLAILVFVLAWIGQFIGHRIEGKRPSFFTDLVYLLVGPLWITAKALRRLGIAY